MIVVPKLGLQIQEQDTANNSWKVSIKNIPAHKFTLYRL